MEKRVGRRTKLPGQNGVVPGGKRLILITSAWLFAGVLLATAAGSDPSRGGFISADHVSPPRSLAFETVDIPPPASRAASALLRAHPKLDTPLTELVRAAQVSHLQLAAVARTYRVRLDDAEVRVHVQLIVAPGTEADIRRAVAAVGGAVTGGYKATVQAWLPPEGILTLTERTNVYRIQTPPTLFEAEAWKRVLFLPLAPTVLTEGLVALNGNTWHSGSHSGAGVKVAIVDGGFGGYAALLGTELPSSLTVKNFVDGENDGDVGTSPLNHGTASAEIIYDVAPGAQLYLVKISTDVDLAEAVSFLIAEGVDIISTSVGWTGVTPNDGTGIFADLAGTARNAGILWTTAAGNFGETHWSGTFVDYGDGTHRFAPNQNWNAFSNEGIATCYELSVGDPINVVLQWDDWTSVTQDFDLYLYRWNGSDWVLVTGSLNDQNGGLGQTPVERIATTAAFEGCYAVGIGRYNATRDVNFDLFAYNMRGLNVRQPARSLVNLADAPAVLTVGAIHHAVPFDLEPASSRGPTNGLGGASTGGSTKPDLVAYANVSTASYGALSFEGTSAATPHVAGAAALIKAAKPSWQPAKIQQVLEDAALDQGSVGKDNQYGSGRLWLANLLSADLVDWPTIVAADQPPTVQWEMLVGTTADTYVGWQHASASGDPPAYSNRSTPYESVKSGFFSATLALGDPAAERYFFRAFLEDADGSVWSAERYINVDPHETADDAWQTAHLLDTPISGVQSYIRNNTDVDWYTFEITRPGTVYTVTLIPTDGMDLDLVLFADVVTPALSELQVMADAAAIGDMVASSGGSSVVDITTLADVVASANFPDGANVSAFSATPGDGAERASHRVWQHLGPQYLMVFGYNGQNSPHGAYRLDIDVNDTRAWDFAPITLPDYRPPVNVSIKTLFVANWNRFNSTYGITVSGEVATALNAIVDNPGILGTVMDLSALDSITNTGIVSQAYASWDHNPTNPYLARNVGVVVQDVISDALRSYPNTQYIVIVGDDAIVPFLRVPDETAIGNERTYRDTAGAVPGSPAFAALDGGFYLTDDCYADPDPFDWPGGRLCVPRLAVGRLVEAPAEITAALDAYRGTPNGVLEARNALVTGYEHLADHALVMSHTLGAQVPVTPLISDSWTASDLQQLWISGTFELQSVNGRFDHFAVGPADQLSGFMPSTRIDDSAWSFGALGFSAGGHAGYSAHDLDFSPTTSPDFAQGMTGKGAVWIANTGYGIGDAANVSYSEELAARFGQHIVNGAGSGVAVGAALMRAKQDYLSEAAPSSISPYALKVLMEATLYGLPQWRIGLAGNVTAVAQNADVTVLETNALAATQPRLGPGPVANNPVDLSTATFTRDITLTLSYGLSPRLAGQIVTATVISVSDSTAILTSTQGIMVQQKSSHGRPQLPMVRLNVTFSNTLVPRGVVMLAGQSAIYAIDPVITRPLTDDVAIQNEPAYAFERWYPMQPFKINRFGSRFGAGAGSGQLVLFPVQFSGTSAAGGVLRAFEVLRLRIHYRDALDASDWQGPVIRQVDTAAGTENVEISVTASDPDPGTGQPSGVEQVLMLYSMGGITWKTDVPLTQGADNVWRATLDLPSGSRASDLNAFLQAIDGAGNVTFSSNKGRLFGSAESPLFLPLLLRNRHIWP